MIGKRGQRGGRLAPVRVDKTEHALVTPGDPGPQSALRLVGEDGDVKDFVMNDKCAAGTGRFLASAAEALGMGLGDIGDISLKAKNPVRLTTVCTVFVESDIMSYLAQGKKTEDILGGVHSAIAARTISLVRRVGIEPEVTFTGGVSLNIGMVRALEEKLGMKLNVSPDSHFVGALGASIFALERTDKVRGEKQQAQRIGAGPTA